MKKLLNYVLTAVLLCGLLFLPAGAADILEIDRQLFPDYIENLYDYLENDPYYTVFTREYLASPKCKIVGYADMKDLDNNGLCEMITIAYLYDSEYDSQTAEVCVWSFHNTELIQTTRETFGMSQFGNISYTTAADGQTYIYVNLFSARQGIENASHTYIGANGIADSVSSTIFNISEFNDTPSSSAYRIINGQYNEISMDEYAEIVSWYGYDSSPENSLASGNGLSWMGWPKEEENFGGYALMNSMKNLLQQENFEKIKKREQENMPPVPTTDYAPYTYIADQYILKFESAILKNHWLTAYFDSYGTVEEPQIHGEVPFIVVRPGSTFEVISETGITNWSDGNDIYYHPDAVTFSSGTINPIQDGVYRIEDFLSQNTVCAWSGLYADIFMMRSDCILPASPGSAEVSSASPDFTDVSYSDYFYEPVQWALDNAITTGTTSYTFSPNDTCTNAQILTFLWRAVGSPEPYGDNPYVDIPENSYYYRAAVWAYENGIYFGNWFLPDAPCTRSQTVTYLWRLAGYPPAAAVNFTDMDYTQEYASAVAWAVAQGITTGTSTTTFSPDSTCTRGQIVTFLYRALSE